jgi:hypothetical protein
MISHLAASRLLRECRRAKCVSTPALGRTTRLLGRRARSVVMLAVATPTSRSALRSRLRHVWWRAAAAPEPSPIGTTTWLATRSSWWTWKTPLTRTKSSASPPSWCCPFVCDVSAEQCRRVFLGCRFGRLIRHARTNLFETWIDVRFVAFSLYVVCAFSILFGVIFVSLSALQLRVVLDCSTDRLRKSGSCLFYFVRRDICVLVRSPAASCSRLLD